MGLPYEALSKRRAARLFGPPDRFRFLARRGMVSRHTQRACIVAESLVASGADAEAFERELARRLRWKARGGSASMAAIIGAALDDLAQVRRLVVVCTRITRADPRGQHGALAVALAAHLAARQKQTTGEGYLRRLRPLLADPSAAELVELIGIAVKSVADGDSAEMFARSIGLHHGVSADAYACVPVCVHAWLANPRDIEAALAEVIRCGGGTDATAAIVGGIVGSGVGKVGIPREWLAGLFEWPRSAHWMEELARPLERPLMGAQKPARVFGPSLIARNAFFALLVFMHRARRCLPPY